MERTFAQSFDALTIDTGAIFIDIHLQRFFKSAHDSATDGEDVDPFLKRIELDASQLFQQ